MKPNILICCSGSVATLKIPEIVVSLHDWANVLVVCSPAAKHFLDKSRDYNPGIYQDFLKINEAENLVITDANEWLAWSRKGDSVLHIELRRWADLLLIAPASANTIAKAANGICDNLLLCVLRAWDPLRPVICCPAMNTRMMDHPSLISHFALLKSYGYEIIEAEVKELACGDIGKGALASVSTIVSRCRVALSTIANRDGERESARESIHSILRSSESTSESTERRVWSVCNRSSPLQSRVLMTCTIVSIFIFGFLTGIRFR